MANKLLPNYRAMMEKAIEVMHQSVAERRSDGRPDLLVGAVLLRPDGTYETAARGELREGNHAEFTLLERKCIGEKLEGCILFTTLEPCLHRNTPKRGCAKHIVSARIKQVYVGIEDDNPAVAGKGIKHLEQHGVIVKMFDSELQEQIVNANQEFFKWARLLEEKSQVEPVNLSKYEGPLVSVAVGDLSRIALEAYREKMGIKAHVGSLAFSRQFIKQGLFVGEADEPIPSGFGFLLFGSDVRQLIPQAGVLARVEFADGTSSREEFGQAMVLIPHQVEAWLRKVLPSTLDLSRMERREQINLPFEMIREAVVNALVHRDYDIEGQKCQLVVNADTIIIKSPGHPIAPITLEQMRSFSAPMKSRNPLLHFVFARMGMAEEQGFGLRSLKNFAEKFGLPLPTYAMEGESLVLTIFRTSEGFIKGLGALAQHLTSQEVRGWQQLASVVEITQSAYSSQLGVTARTAQRHLSHFVELGLLRRSGNGRASKYIKP